MVFAFLKTKRSAHFQKKNGKAIVEVDPLRSQCKSMDRPVLSPNPLTQNPLSHLHWTRNAKSQDETACIIPRDLSATPDLSYVTNRVDHLTKSVPELNLGGSGSTERCLKTQSPVKSAVDELVADQASAQQRLGELECRHNALAMLPAASFQMSVESTAQDIPANDNKTTKPFSDFIPKETMAEKGWPFPDTIQDIPANDNSKTTKPSFDLIPKESMAEHGWPFPNIVAEPNCDACKTCFKKCSTCCGAAKDIIGHHICCAGTRSAQGDKTLLLPRSRNPGPESVARLDKRPVPLWYDPASPASICPSLLGTLTDNAPKLWFNAEPLALLSGSTTEDEDEDEDAAEICQVTELGVVYQGAKVVELRPVRR